MSIYSLHIELEAKDRKQAVHFFKYLVKEHDLKTFIGERSVGEKNG